MIRQEEEELIGKWVTPRGSGGDYVHLYKCLGFMTGDVMVCSALTHPSPEWPAHYLKTSAMRLATDKEIAHAIALKIQNK